MMRYNIFVRLWTRGSAAIPLVATAILAYWAWRIIQVQA